MFKRENAFHSSRTNLKFGFVLLIITLFMGGLFLFAQPVEAATLTVDDTATADFNSIQTAINNATSTDTIEVEPGTYNESVTIDKQGITLESTDGSTTTIISADATEGVMITKSDVTVRGFTVTTNKNDTGTHGQYGIRVEPSSDVSNILIENNAVKDISDKYRPAGISIDMKDGATGGTNVVADDITIRNNVVRNITSVESTSYTGFAKGINPNERVNNLIIENNTIKNIGGPNSAGANGIDFSSDTDPSSNVGPKHFTIKGNDIDGITVGEEASDPWLDDNAIYFHDYGDLGDHVVTENKFKEGEFLYNTKNVDNPDTLNAKHNYWGAPSGPSGEGNGDGIVVSKNVDYRPWYATSDLSEKVEVIDSSSNVRAYSGTIQGGIDASNSGDTVSVSPGTYEEGITIDKGIMLESTDGRDSTTISTDKKVGVMIESSDVTVRGFTVTTNNPDNTDTYGEYGIRLEPSDDVDVNDILIEDNIVENIKDNYRPSGISLDMKGTTDKTATNVTVRNNIVRNITSVANESYDVVAKAINPNERFNNLVIENNTIQNIGGPNSAGALGIDFSSDTGVDPNIGPKNFTIKGNDIDGITIGEEVSTVWKDAIAFYLHAYGDLGNEHVVTENNFKEGRLLYNTKNVDSPDTLNAEHNYWGAPSGPSGEGNGDGIVVSANVDYRPWLLEENGDQYDQTVALTNPGEWSLVSPPRGLSELPTVWNDGTSNANEDVSVFGHVNGEFQTPSNDNPAAKDIQKPTGATFMKPTNKAGVGFKYENPNTGQTTYSKDLVNGWNLIGSNTHDVPNNELSSVKSDNNNGSGVTTLNVPETYNAKKDLRGTGYNGWGGPQSQDIDISNWPSDQDFSSYDGFWVFSNSSQSYSKVGK